MNKKLFAQWHAEGLLSEGSFNKIKDQEGTGLFSVYWEIKSLFYLAVLLLSGGLGILIYKACSGLVGKQNPIAQYLVRLWAIAWLPFFHQHYWLPAIPV